MKKRIITISSVIISLILVLSYIIIGSPVVLANNQKLKEEILAVHSEYVTLNEIVPFEWDTLYTFDPYTTKEEIERIIGFNSSSIKETVSEGMVQLLFVNDQKVVSSICSYADILGYGIDFSGKILYTDHAVFSVERDTDILYLLYNN